MFVGLSLSLAGCFTAPPLRTQAQREQVGKITGFAPDRIEFMNHCFFEEIAEPESDAIGTGKRGMIAVTDTEICIVEGALQNAPKDYSKKIPLSEIVGVYRSYNQVQIQSRDKLIVFFLYHWNDHATDAKRTNEFYETLILKDVPSFESDREYSLSRFTASTNSAYARSSNPYDVGETNYDNSLQSIRSYENRYDPWDPVRLTNESK